MTSSDNDPQRISDDAPTAERPPGSIELRDQMIGEFRVLRQIGRGGMADVYLADQTSLNRQVAVKVLRRELLTDEKHVRRFEREARAAAGLRHANIVQVYTIGSHDGVHYIAQEFVQGWNLKDYLNKKGPPDLSVALHVMKQVASALAASGDAGIVHRDIKPENILITRKAEVKVADFGLAQLALGADNDTLTQVGIAMGTPRYMSPEQVSGEKVDPRSDIYSFGVTCYHMLTGRAPFQGETALAIAMQHLNRTPEPIFEKRPDLPQTICDIVHKMMARNPDDRYPDAHALLADLRKLSKQLKEGSGEIPQMSLSSPQIPQLASDSMAFHWISRALRSPFFRWPLSRHLATLLGVALLVGGSSAALGWWLRPSNPLQTPAKEDASFAKQNSVEEQYARAMLADTEEAWQSILVHFPDGDGTRHYRRLAQERLAWLALSQDQLDEARTLYTELASLGKEDQRFEAAGLAGKAVIASLQGNYEESQRIIASDLLPKADRLNAEMARMVRDTIERNRKKLGEQVAKGLEDRFHATAPDDDEPAATP